MNYGVKIKRRPFRRGRKSFSYKTPLKNGIMDDRKLKLWLSQVNVGRIIIFMLYINHKILTLLPRYIIAVLVVEVVEEVTWGLTAL